MLGFVLAVVVEASTGKNVIQQTQTEQLPIALVVVTFIVASLVPIVRGVPRKGNSIFTADAELWNGRLVSLLYFASLHAMLPPISIISLSLPTGVKRFCTRDWLQVNSCCYTQWTVKNYLM